MIAPVGHVYQAGTLSGNPVAMAAGLTQLKILKNHPEIYTHMSQMGEKLYEGMKELVKNTETMESQPYRISGMYLFHRSGCGKL